MKAFSWFAPTLALILILFGSSVSPPVRADDPLPYGARPLVVAEGQARVDLAPPERTFRDRSGITILSQKGAATTLNQYLFGVTYGYAEGFEIGIEPISFVSTQTVQSGDVPIHARVALPVDGFDLAGDLEILLPFGPFNDFDGRLSLPVAFRGETLRLATGLGLQWIKPVGASDDIRAHLPLELAVTLGERFFLGPEARFVTSISQGFSQATVGAGLFCGYTAPIDNDYVDFIVSFSFPRTLSWGTGPIAPLDVWQIQFGMVAFFMPTPL